MKMVLALLLSVSVILISIHVVGTAIGDHEGSGFDSHGAEDPTVDATAHANPLLVRSGSDAAASDIPQDLLSTIKAEKIFNGSDMERRLLAIKVPLEDKKATAVLPPHAAGELIVKLRPGASFGPAPAEGAAVAQAHGLLNADQARSLDDIGARYGAKRISKVFRGKGRQERQQGMALMTDGDGEDGGGLSRIYKLELDEDADVASAIAEFSGNPLVEYAEPNYIYRTFDTPNDASFPQQWAHAMMGSEDAWDTEIGDPVIIIAIVDTGVDWDHPDLAGNVWNNTDEGCNESFDLDGNGISGDCRGYDFVDNALASGCTDADCEDEDNDPMDGHGHGTHCSGIAAAVTDNSIGVAGVCRNCTIMPIRAGFKYGTQGVLKTDDIVQALEYAVNNSADIISMSFGGTHSSLMKDAIDDAYSKGAILIAAAGNENTASYTLSYPAAYDNVISVSATKNDDKKASYSNYGYWVDVAAPGGDSPYSPSTAILSTMVNDNYASWMGTSMACPHVAGLAGLILSRNSSFSQEEVMKIIKSSTDPVDHDEYMGFGRINLRKAMLIDEVPESNISSLSFGEVLDGSVDIYGTASGANFINYTLSFGYAPYPSSWNQINFSTSEVNDGKLGTWDTTFYPDGLYTVLLQVNSSGGWSEDRVVVRVMNNGTVCMSCEDCEYKVNNYQNASLFLLDGDISSTDGDCIGIDRDDVILNCDSNNITGQGEGSGILVESDGVDIRNCVIENFQYGIFLDMASGSTLINNSMNGNGVGLWVSGSAIDHFDHYIDTGNTVGNRPVNYYFDVDDIVISLGEESGHLEVAYSGNVNISGNSVYGDGIKLDRVTGSLIEDNSVIDAKAGILIDDGSSGNNLTGNSISKSQDYQQGVYFEDFTSLFNYIDDTNTVNSEPLLHFHEAHGTPASPITPSPIALSVANVTNVGRIMAVNSSFINISGLDISGSVYAVYAYQSANLSISSNTMEDNEGGIVLIQTNGNSVTENEVHNNALVGIYSGNSANSAFEGNNVTGTSQCYYELSFFGMIFTIDFGGIGIGDDGSTVRWNNLSGNNCSGVTIVGDGNLVHGNTIDGNMGGLYVGGSGNAFTGNQVTNHFGRYGLFVESMATAYNHINQSNTVNGEPLHYYYDVHGTGGDPVTLDSISLHEVNASNIGKITIINSSHVNITNSDLSLNGFGVYILDSDNIGLHRSAISDVEYGYSIQSSGSSVVRSCNITGTGFNGLYLHDAGDLVVYENNIISTALDGEEPVFSDEAIELSYQGSGNFWGHTEPPYFTPGTDSNADNVTDSYAYGMMSGWDDGDPPGLAFIYPTPPDGNHTNGDWIFVNVSSDENLSGCLLGWEYSGSNVSMSVVRDDDRTYCYLNMTALDGGWYYFTVYADDPSHNLNSTPRRSARVNPPPAINSSSVLPHLLISGENISIIADVADADSVSHVYYNISGASGAEGAPMQQVSGSTYGANVTFSSTPGTYNVSIFANDTLGAWNATIIDAIELRAARSITLLFRDHAGNVTNMSLSVLNPADGFARDSAEDVSNLSFQVPEGSWDLNLSRGFWIIMHDADFTDDLTARFSIDDVPVQVVDPPTNKQFRSVIAAETNLSFGDAHIAIPYSGLISDEDRIVAYMCADWNITGRNCDGGWGNSLDEGDDYALDKGRDIIIMNASGFSAYALGESILLCGNGVVDDPAEECDGGDKDGETCQSMGYDYGSLGCTGSCLLDTSGCSYSGGGGYTASSMQITDYPQSITVKQGGSTSVSIGVRNTGSTNLTGVSLSAITDCSGCQVQVTPSSQNIGTGMTGNFSLLLSVLFTQGLGAYYLDLSATSGQQETASVRSSLVIEESPMLCVPGSVKCSLTGNLVKCKATGDGWETEQVCTMGCDASACKTLCTGGQTRCSGSVLQQCRSDGGVWEDVERCQDGCDTGSLTCKTVIGSQPMTGDRRCSDNTVQQYIDGGWMIVEECSMGCENSTCVAGGIILIPEGFDFGVIIWIVVAIVIVGGAGYFYYSTSMKELTWDSLEHKWEVIETNSAELLSNAEHFLNKKVRISGRISESMQERTGVMGYTLEDHAGQVLIFSNPPGPKGRVELTGFVSQNEFGEVFVEVESFKTDWLWFISILHSLKINEMLQKLRVMIGSMFQKRVKKT